MAAGWIEALTGPLDEKRRYRQGKARIKQLPANYRTAVEALERYLMHAGGIVKGDVVVTIGLHRAERGVHMDPGDDRLDPRMERWRVGTDDPQPSVGPGGQAVQSKDAVVPSSTRLHRRGEHVHPLILGPLGRGVTARGAGRKRRSIRGQSEIDPRVHRGGCGFVPC
ncbi:MAG: hypothetical protein QM619_00910 [Micropruina sp.]|uniref:hypothetical protein n=1 Tax=Micropruina sp. TaxID=2737536 RepID=UPI0039E5E67C